MNKRLSGLLTMAAIMFAGSAVTTNANAVETKASLAMISQDSASHIDRVLGELSRQHDGASSLVKSARQPTSLALSSSLLASDTAQDIKIGTDRIAITISIIRGAITVVVINSIVNWRTPYRIDALTFLYRETAVTFKITLFLGY